jgi:hypothetical protein
MIAPLVHSISVSTCTYLAIDFLDRIADPNFMTFTVGGKGTYRVPSHGDLMRPDDSDLSVLVQHTKRVAFGLEDDTDILSTRERMKISRCVTMDTTYSSCTRS